MPTSHTRLLKVDEAAERLRVSRMSLYRLLDRGELPSLHVGQRARRIPEDAVERYIAAQIAAASSGGDAA